MRTLSLEPESIVYRNSLPNAFYQLDTFLLYDDFNRVKIVI